MRPATRAALTAAFGFLFLTVLLGYVGGALVVNGPPAVVVDPGTLGMLLASVVGLLLVMLLLGGSDTSARRRTKALVLLPAVLPLVLTVAIADVVVDRAQPPFRCGGCSPWALPCCRSSR